MHKIVIDSEVLVITYFDNNILTMDNGTEYIIFEDRETAGEVVSDYYRDMAENDKEEFICMVGKETLIDWGLGRFAGPGQEKTKNLEEWLDLVGNYPEEHHASYDGEEISDVKFNRNFANAVGFGPENCVLYRTN